MSRIASVVICLLAGCGLTFSQRSMPRQPSYSEVEATIAKVKDTPASNLDNRLANAHLESWLQAQAGTDGKVNWNYVDAAEVGGSWPCVQAVITLNKEQSAFVSIHVDQRSSRLSFESGWVITRPGHNIELRRLSDLPKTLSKIARRMES